MRVAIIWDLDGTLLDSYEIIVNSLHQIYLEKGIALNKEEILFDVINESVSYFIKKMEILYGIPFDDLKDRYSIISGKEKFNIKAMDHAAEILDYLKNKGIANYVFTHRGKTTESVLENVGLSSYFEEIVNSLNNFARKPSPEGLEYLINKYQLDRDNTYYVGDRPIDIKCANNAHITSIMYVPKQSVAKPTQKETYIISDLLDLKELFK